jgi:GAF domain-containing protein
LANFYNLPVEELLGKPYFPLLPQKEQERSRKHIERLKYDKQQTSTEQVILSLDGETRWISWTDRPLYDRSGNFLEYQSVGHDITAQKLRQREMEAIVTITAALRSAQNRSDMAPIIIDQLMPMLSASGAALAVLDETRENLVVELGRGVWAEAAGKKICLNESLAGVAIDLAKAYGFPSAAGKKLPPAFELGDAQASIACVPLVAQENPMGVIWVGRRPHFNANDLHLITAISDIAANAFNRSELHEQTKKQLTRLTALRAIDMAISASLDLNVTLDILVEQIVNQLGVHAAILLKFDIKTQTLKIAAGNGIAGKYLRQSILNWVKATQGVLPFCGK